MIDGTKLLNNSNYSNILKKISTINLPWQELQNKAFYIAGSTGLIGSCFIDTLMTVQKEKNISFNIFASGRSKIKLEERFSSYLNNNNFYIIEQNVLTPLSDSLINQNIDYIIHLASNTHPVDYATKPIETILANINGTKNLLDFACKKNTSRFIYASSVEIYGENKNDIEQFDESYCGYIDCNTLRAGYPEGKRAGEALCQAYIKEKNLDIVIPRFCRIYGPTMLMSDTKALSQFIKNTIDGEDIILKSKGSQYFSYLDVFDAVTGLLYCLFFGQNGQAYNIADGKSDITLKKLAELLAKKAGTKVIFDLPSETEQAGFSKATKALLNPAKIQNLGWSALYDIDQGLEYTISILKSIIN